VAYKSEESRRRSLEPLKIRTDLNRQIAQEKEMLYDSNPKKCVCGKVIPYSKRLNDYCSHSCAAKVISKTRKVARYAKVYKCKNCGALLHNQQRVCCSKSCLKIYKSKERHKKFLSGLMKDIEIRSYFRSISEKKCTICGGTEWNGKPIPLVVDHIDGNSDNGDPSNVRIICCNCDAQLPTYKGANVGKGRTHLKKSMT
jgi:predicted RNA-binding Zn-ribbon protein involved in translation (DUF1610 family)